MTTMSRSRVALPPLRSSSINRRNDGDDGEVDMAKLRQRFDKQLPKYGFLWRSMANARMKEGTAKDGEEGSSVNSPAGGQGAKERQDAVDKENAAPSMAEVNKADPASAKEVPNLLDAILNKQPVTLRVPVDHDLCGEGCDCADPIIEIDNVQDADNEDASVYDVNVDEELADTDDEGSKASKQVSTEKGEGGVELAGDVVLGNVSIDSDDESIVMISKTPRKKAFIIDSDDEDSIDAGSNEEESEDANEPKYDEAIGDGSDRSIESVEDDSFIEQDDDAKLGTPRAESDVNSSTDGPAGKTGRSQRSSARLVNSAAKPKPLYRDDGSEASSSSEEEWIELSSDEEEEAPPKQRINTVVILSGDEEEESESESDDDDAHSAFTVSDDSDSDGSSIPAGRGRRQPEPTTTPAGRPTKRKPTNTRRAKPSKNFRTPPRKENADPNSQAKTSDPRSTLAFRKNREALTSHTFAEFNRKAFQGALSSVKVSWSNKLNTTAGITRMKGKLGEDNAHTRVATIELATKVIDDEERLRSTLLHEMCHAAQWLVDGSHKPPHGKLFKKWAAVSMRKIRDVEVTTTHDYQIVYKFAWACTASNCNVVIKRHSRSVDPTKHCCGRCQGKLIEIEVPGSKGDTARTGYTAKKERKASEFALFVKSQSKSVRNSLAKKRSCSPKEVSQADVVKECGALWRSRKSSSSSEAESDGLESMADRLVSLTLGGGESP